MNTVPATRRHHPKKPLTDLVRETLDDLVDVIATQLQLLRVELAADLGDAARDASRIAVFAVFLGVGYVFSLLGLSFWLTRWLDTSAAFAAVGGSQIVVGATGGWLALRRLRAVRFMDRSGAQITETVAEVKSEMQRAPNGNSTGP